MCNGEEVVGFSKVWVKVYGLVELVYGIFGVVGGEEEGAVFGVDVGMVGGNGEGLVEGGFHVVDAIGSVVEVSKMVVDGDVVGAIVFESFVESDSFVEVVCLEVEVGELVVVFYSRWIVDNGLFVVGDTFSALCWDVVRGCSRCCREESWEDEYASDNEEKSSPCYPGDGVFRRGLLMGCGGCFWFLCCSFVAGRVGSWFWSLRKEGGEDLLEFGRLYVTL